MQYCQLRYIINIFLLNGLFVLSSHAMEKAVVTNIDCTNDYILKNTTKVSLPNCNCEIKNITQKRKRKKYTFEEKKKQQRREENRIPAAKSRARLNDAIKAITQETDAVGDGATGLKNALVVIRELKRKYDLLKANNKWQIKTRIRLLKSYHELTKNSDDRKTMEAANKKLDGEYKAALYKNSEQDKTIETFKSKIETMKKKLKESNAIHGNMRQYISSLEQEIVPLKVAFAKSQIENDELQKQYSELQKLHEDSFTLDFKEQNSNLFPNSGR